jgi:molybdopterin synthase catalytic subunit
MRVRVVYFGILRDMAGREHETVELGEAARLGDLYSSLQDRIPGLESFGGSIALSINYEYAKSDAPLRDGDEVALLPPVSGGAPDVAASHKGFSRVQIVHEPLDANAIIRAIKRPEDGAVAVFDGIVRNHSRGRRTLYLEYIAYEPMAAAELDKLAQNALANYPIRDVRIIHRLGRLEIGETSVLIVVASAHRAAAFDAARWIIDTLKKTVPIWKKEFFEGGAVWADGEPFPEDISVAPQGTSK